jgi:hypothetical protein
MPDTTVSEQYVSLACRQVGGHPICQQRPIVRCGCPCHNDVSALVWRVGDLIVVTSGDGDVDDRRGNLKWARDLAEHIGLRIVSGTPVGREEWVQGMLVDAWDTSRHPSFGSRQHLSAPDSAQR